MFRYPKSFLNLLSVGFALVALPLIFALVNSALSLNRLANQSQRAVYQAAQATQASRVLSDTITGMERIARQFLILGDAAQLDDYAQLRQKFLQTSRQFSVLPLNDAQTKLLGEIAEKEQKIYSALSDPQAEAPALNAAVEEFPALSGLAQTLMANNNDLIEREVGALKQMAEDAQRLVLWQLLALIPVALLLVAGVVVLISRPIRQLDQAIRQLGNAEFKHGIQVKGPQDMEYLGHQLDWLRLRLIELEEQKGKFLRHVSHELKTPLTALREGSELLTEEVAGKLNPEQREIVRILRDNSIQLRKLIENLLNFSAAQYHKSALNVRPVALRDVVAKVASDQKIAMYPKELKLETDCDEVTLRGDEDKLAAIVDNLLSNAIKFSPQGGTIRVSLKKTPDHAVLEVRDDGPGISPLDRDKVFDPFYQGRSVSTGPVKGTGLGLSIVRENVVAHDGQVEIVEDGAPRGAHFRVVLPLAREAA